MERKINGLFNTNSESYHFKEGSPEYLIDKETFIEEVTKLVHKKACEAQKDICCEKATIVSKNYMDFIDANSILNSPNSKFE